MYGVCIYHTHTHNNTQFKVVNKFKRIKVTTVQSSKMRLDILRVFCVAEIGATIVKVPDPKKKII